MKGWIKSVFDIALIVLIVIAAKDRHRRALLRTVRLDGADAANRR